MIAQSSIFKLMNKKGPGRPKGSKNKPKDEDQSNSNNQQFGSFDAPVSNIRPIKHNIYKEPQSRPGSNRIYTELAKTSLGNTELYNLYGIVIDSSSPHKKKQFYRQLLKIIDPSFYYKYPRDNTDPNNGCVSVTFFAPKKEQLP